MADNDTRDLIGILSMPETLSGMLSGIYKMSGCLANETLRGYSAYDIYVQCGGTMTEEEWLESLKGESIELRNNNGVLEWKYESDETWMELIDLTKAIKIDLSDYVKKEDFQTITKQEIDDIMAGGDQ